MLGILLFALSGVRLEKTPTPPLNINVYPTGIIGVNAGSVYHWSLNGQLINHIEAKGRVQAATCFSGEYIVSYLTSSERLFVAIYDRNGFSIGVEHGFCKQFFHADGHLYWAYFEWEKMRKVPYPYLAAKIKLAPGGARVAVEERFAKLKRKSQYLFPKVWVARSGDDVLVVSEVAPEVSVLGRGQRLEESLAGGMVPSKVEPRQIDLPGFVPAPEKPYQIKELLPVDEARKRQKAWHASFSKVHWFGSVLGGYAVGYRLPGGKAVYVALNADLKRVADPHEIAGQVVGAVGPEIFIWEPGAWELDTHQIFF